MMWEIIIFLVGLIGISLIFSYLQIQHCQQVMQKLTKKKSGYFGMGVSKSKYRTKQILLLTTDNSGVINECKILSGVTVFARFQNNTNFIGFSVYDLPIKSFPPKYSTSLAKAVEMILSEMKK